MGSVCSCFHIEDFEDYAYANASICTHCICLRCLTQQLIHVYMGFFRRGEVRAIPSSVEGTAPLASAALVTDDFIPDTYRSPPRPLPYDDPRFSRLQRDGLVSRRDKSSSHFHEESEPLRRNSNDTEMEPMSRVDKWCGSNYEGESKLYHSESLLKHPLTEDTTGATYFFPSSEDEDVCPTCLEEYTSENPRIIMQCTHHFHLSCIYEWMERSDACPVCGKLKFFPSSVFCTLNAWS